MWNKSRIITHINKFQCEVFVEKKKYSGYEEKRTMYVSFSCLYILALEMKY